MTASEFYKLLKLGFPFTPTLKQDAGLQQLATFITSSSKQHVFLLKGYAGTGKTTSVHALARQLLGSSYSAGVLELNASDARGIDVVRNKIKGFAMNKVNLPPGR